MTVSAENVVSGIIMNKQTSHALIAAAQEAYNGSQGAAMPKEAFARLMAKNLDALLSRKVITPEEHLHATNSLGEMYDAIVGQSSDPSDDDTLMGMRTTVKMFGPQFMIDDSIKELLVTQLGAYPVWGVVSTWAADTLYTGLTFPEARHRAAIEAAETGREASIVLQLEHFQGPPLMPPFSREEE